ncbi:hypothetical protein BJ741DRAFT_603258 [Chytriomyces cf. hyalinus JEL632]|nr:hypothetical protein BJ741DRAFT_603258 [Chytriomyces cf. hyalinus JEL632]
MSNKSNSAAFTVRSWFSSSDTACTQRPVRTDYTRASVCVPQACSSGVTVTCTSVGIDALVGGNITTNAPASNPDNPNTPTNPNTSRVQLIAVSRFAATNTNCDASALESVSLIPANTCVARNGGAGFVRAERFDMAAFTRSEYADLQCTSILTTAQLDRAGRACGRQLRASLLAEPVLGVEPGGASTRTGAGASASSSTISSSPSSITLPSANSADASNASASISPTVIAGAVIGGTFALILIALAIWCGLKRRNGSKAATRSPSAFSKARHSYIQMKSTRTPHDSISSLPPIPSSSPIPDRFSILVTESDVAATAAIARLQASSYGAAPVSPTPQNQRFVLNANEWTVLDVYQWMLSNNWPESSARVFKDHQIKGRDLLQLNESEMVALGLETKPERVKLRSELKLVRELTAAGSRPVSPPPLS